MAIGGLPSKQRSALLLIFLVIGSEARRIETSIKLRNLNSPSGQHAAEHVVQDDAPSNPNLSFTTVGTGTGACRANQPTDRIPIASYTYAHDFSGSLEDCQTVCASQPQCKAIEYKLVGSNTHCELHTQEPHATSGDPAFTCMKKMVTATSYMGVWSYRLNGRGLFYDIESVDDNLVITQAMLSKGNVKMYSGQFVVVGDWMVAVLTKADNSIYGTVRVQLRDGNLVSIFQHPGQEWSDPIVASRDTAVIRGWLKYKENLMCAVLSKDNSEGGAGLLELYRESDLQNGCGGTLPHKPHRALLFRADDAAMLDSGSGQAGDEVLVVSGDKFYWDLGEDGDMQEKTMYFSLVSEKLSMRFMGKDAWTNMSSTQEAAQTWLNALRMTQSVGVQCLEKGTCLAQCTYVESLGECSSDFCTLEKTSWWWSSLRPRCMPKVGAQASLEGWETLKRRTHEQADWVYSTGCVGSCPESWRHASRNLHLANELSREFASIEEAGLLTSMPEEMKKVFLKIKEETGKLSEDVAEKLGAGFDFIRYIPTSPVQPFLTMNGCRHMPEGAIQALFRLDAADENAREEAHSAFQHYTDACPWFKTLASSPEAAKEAATAEKRSYQAAAGGSNDTKVSLLQAGDQVPVLDIIIITAVVASLFVIATGIGMVISGTLCSPRPEAANMTNNGFAHKFCAKKHLQTKDHCWQNRMLPGIYVIVGGFFTLALTGLAVWSVSAGVAAALATKAAGTTGLTIAGAGAAGTGTTGLTIAGAGAAGTAAVTTVEGWIGRIKSGLVGDVDTPAQEEMYVKCMKTFQEGGVGPENATTDGRTSTELPGTAQGTPGRRIVGLDELLKQARIGTEVIEMFHTELASLGVVSVDELICGDWNDFNATKVMKVYERRRFDALVCPPTP